MGRSPAGYGAAAPSRRSRQNRVSKGTMSLWQSPEAAPLAGFGAAPQGRPQVDDAFRRSAKGEFPNSPVDCLERGNALQERAFPQKLKATPHKARLTALHVICLHIFRHITQKSLDRRQPACVIFMQSDEKSDCASAAQSLCGVALMSVHKKAEGNFHLLKMEVSLCFLLVFLKISFLETEIISPPRKK